MDADNPITYPFDDEEMYFDKLLRQYVLTPKAAENLGINFLARLRQKGAVNAEIVAKNTMEEVSYMIYSYLHDQVFDDNLQDFVIAKVPSARPIIKRALQAQFKYYMQVGNLSRSSDMAKRLLAIDETAKSILQRRLPELGHSLVYRGTWRCRCWGCW